MALEPTKIPPPPPSPQFMTSLMSLPLYTLQRQFAEDNKVASATINFPADVMTGKTVDDWFPLSGKQGDGKEGMINLVMTFTVSKSFVL